MEKMYEKAVNDFAKDMKRKLIENKHKGHWGQDQPEELFRRLLEEAGELIEAVIKNAPYSAVAAEAADVGNIAMMIADIYHKDIGGK